MADTISTNMGLTNTTAYPAFASKAELMKALMDQHNEHDRDPLMLAARLANTDTSAWADPTGALPVVTPSGP